jgi:ribosomal-protein-alanine N-acetyltransferase
VEIQDIFADLATVETERLVLRKLVPGDLESIFDYASDPQVARFTTWMAHASIEDSRAFLDYVLEQYAAGRIATWGVEHKRDQKLIGTSGFVGWSIRHARAEIGYALSRRYWNRGLATEALRAMIDFGFRHMQLNRIQGRCVLENVASARVMEKAGMKAEGVLREHEVSDTPGVYLDIRMYSILRREWKE